jgi:hypothetical protein
MFVTYNEIVVLFVVSKLVVVTHLALNIMKLITEQKLVINIKVIMCWCVDVICMASNWKT